MIKVNIENIFNLGPCEDNPQYAENCADWATHYDGKGCTEYESFMSEYCKKSCNETCGPEGKFYLLFNGQK